MNGNTSLHAAISAMCKLMPMQRSAGAIMALIFFMVAVLIAPNVAAFPYDAGDAVVSLGYCEKDPTRLCDLDDRTTDLKGCGGRNPPGVGPCIFDDRVGYCEKKPSRACAFPDKIIIDNEVILKGCANTNGTSDGPCLVGEEYASPTVLNGYSVLFGDVGKSIIISCEEENGEQTCLTFPPPAITYNPDLAQICMSGLMVISRADNRDVSAVYQIRSNDNPNDPFRVDPPVCDENDPNCIPPGYGQTGPLGLCFSYVKEEIEEVGPDPTCDKFVTGGECTQNRTAFTVNLKDVPFGVSVSEVVKGVLVFDKVKTEQAGLGSVDCNPNYVPGTSLDLPCWIELGLDEYAFSDTNGDPTGEACWGENCTCIDALGGPASDPVTGNTSPTTFGFDTRNCDVLKLVEKQVVAPTEDNDPFRLAGTRLLSGDNVVLREALGLVLSVCNDANPNLNGGKPSCQDQQLVAGAYKAGDDITVNVKPNYVCVDEPTPEALFLALTPYTDGRRVVLVGCSGNDTIVASQEFSATGILNTPSDGGGTLDGLNIVGIRAPYFNEVPSRNDATYDFTNIATSGVKIVMNNLVDTVITGNNSVFVDLGQGDDIGIGGNGSQTFYGGRNDDEMTGGAGPDCFVMHDSQGKDLIKDFNALEGDLLIDDTVKSKGITKDLDLCRFYTGSKQYVDLKLKDGSSCPALEDIKKFTDEGVSCPDGRQ